MSQNFNKQEDPTKTAGADIAKCDREGCNNIASLKPVVQLRSNAAEIPCEAFMGLKVCITCGTEKNAADLIEGDEARMMFESIFKVQTQGKKVDWSCSGVVWVLIN